MKGTVVAVASDRAHDFTKPLRPAIRLIAGLGVEGDAHAGVTVQHRSRLATTPDAPNLRQVHLLQVELFGEMATRGFAVTAGMLGENVTTEGIDLLALARGVQLRLGEEAVVEITGLRNPCRQIDENAGPGAMAATLSQAPDGSLVRRAGVMAIVVTGGEVRAGDGIAIVRRPEVEEPLAPV